MKIFKKGDVVKVNYGNDGIVEFFEIDKPYGGLEDPWLTRYENEYLYSGTVLYSEHMSLGYKIKWSLGTLDYPPSIAHEWSLKREFDNE